MLQCPQCTKPLRQLSRRCPTCQADLDLLVDYVNTLQTGVERAEGLTRAGELGQAIWAYLEVLEADPDNTAARRQIGGVVTAVRQFDAATPARRWANNLPPLPDRSSVPPWLRWLLTGTLVVLAFCAGVLVGQFPPDFSSPNGPAGDDPGIKKDVAPPPQLDKQDRLS